MPAFAPPPSLSEAVKKVDRAVARLEELQSTIRNSCGNGDWRRYHQAPSLGRPKVDVHGEKKPTTSRRSMPGSGKDAHWTRSEWHRWSTSAGRPDGRVPEIVQTLSRVGTSANKENVGVKKKKKKKLSPMHLPELSPSARKPLDRRVLESRPVNVIADQGLPSASCSGSDEKWSIENRRPKAVDTARSSNPKPPWRNAAIISTNNRHPATIAERVRPSSATTSGAQNRMAGSACGDYLTSVKGQRRASLPVSGRTSKAGLAATCSPSSAREELDFAKTFCVDVRPNPNRPWRLACKMSINARPLVMFPNPAFRSYADEGMHEDAGVTSNKLPPKLTPFKSFQIRPLKLSSLQQQPSFVSSPATIRPYLSPSKTSPRQSQRQEEDPLAYLFDSTAPSGSTLRCTKKPANESNAPASKESWLRKRLSLPCSPSSSGFIRRFSLSHSKQKSNTTHSPVKPLPALITRLPTRKKPTSLDSVANMLPPQLEKPLSRSPKATPLISPLPLPPALRVLTSKSHNLSPNKLEASVHKRSSSCHLHGEDHKDQRENVVCRSLSSRGIQEPLESSRKKSSHGFPGCSGNSVWPSIKRSSSACKPHILDCTSNCTGAGPCLFKHVRGWMLSHKPNG